MPDTDEGRKLRDEALKFCDEARNSAELLEGELADPPAALQEYQRYCAIASSIQSLVKWEDNLVSIITREHPNTWHINAVDGSDYQSTYLYNDIFSSFYSSFAILFNTCCAQTSVGTESFGATLPSKRFLFKCLLGLIELIRNSFQCYLSHKNLSTELARCLHSDAFEALFSLIDLFMAELLLSICIDKTERGDLSNTQEFSSALSLYTDLSISLQQQLSSTHDQDPIFVAIQQDISARAPLLLAHAHCSFAKAMIEAQDLPVAAAYAQKADGLLQQYTTNSNQAPLSEQFDQAIQDLQCEISGVKENCGAAGTAGTADAAEIPYHSPLSKERLREILLADDAEYETLDHYRLLLSWDSEKKLLIFTPPEKDSIGSFNAAFDELDLDDVQENSQSAHEKFKLTDEDAPNSPSASASNIDKQEPSDPNTDEKVTEEPSSDTHNTDQFSQKSSQPSMLYLDHQSAVDDLSSKEEHPAEAAKTSSVELPTLAIEKPSKVPTPTLTNSLIDRTVTGDIPIDHAYKTKLPVVDGMFPPRSAPAATGLEERGEQKEMELPQSLAPSSESFNVIPSNYKLDASESDAHDVPSASTQHSEELLPINNKESYDIGEPPEVPDEAPQTHELPAVSKSSDDPDKISHTPYLGDSPEAVNTEKDATLQDNFLPPASHLSEDDGIDSMTAEDLVCNKMRDSFEHDSAEVPDPENDGSGRRALFDEIAMDMQQSMQSGNFMEDSSRVGESVRATRQEMDNIINDMKFAQSDDSLKISSNTSLHSSGNEVVASKLSPNLVKPSPLTADPPATTVDVNAVIAEKINPEEAMNAAAPVFMANMRSTSLGPTPNLVENALSYCEEVSLHQSVTSSAVTNIVLSVGSGATFSASTDSIKKFLSDSQTSLGMNHSLSLSHSYIDKARIRKKIRLLRSRAERTILVVLLVVFVVAILCTL